MENFLTVYFLPHWEQWLYSSVIFAFIMLIRLFFKKIVLSFLLSLRDRYNLEDIEGVLKAFDQPIQFFLLILAIYAFFTLSPLPVISVHPSLNKILRSAIIFNFIWGLYNISDAGHSLFLRLLRRTSNRFDENLAFILSTCVHVLIVILGFVMIAKEWEFDITAFAASLGIGSLAVALAAKDALANVFGGLTILLDKPFVIGDRIKVGTVEGTAENITFRSTCLRTFDRELVYLPNSLLSNVPIINYTRREKQRLEYKLGVTYETTATQLQAVIKDIKEYLEHSRAMTDDDYYVNFYEFADSALIIRVVCYTVTTNPDEYLNAREQFNYTLLHILDKNGVSCAFPSTSIYFANDLPTTSSDLEAKTTSPTSKI